MFTARVTISVAAAGISSFALLYAPQPVLPQLADAFRLDAGTASLAISVATGALAVAVLPVAALSEILGRRAVIMAAVSASALLALLLPVAPTYAAFLVIRALQGVAIAGFAGVAAAYLVERLGGSGVAAGVGAMIAGNTVGGMSGRLAAGLSIERLGWHGAINVVTVIGLGCSAITLLTLPGRPPRGADARRFAKRLGGVLRGVVGAFRRRVLLVQYAVALLGMGSFVALYNSATFRLTGQPLDLSPAIASLVFCAYAMGALASATAGRLIGRFGRRRSLIGALATMAAGVALTLPDSLPVVVLGFVVLTGGFFAAHAVANGWAAAEAPASGRGQVTGLYTLAYYLGSSLGGTLGSVVYARAGWPALVAVTVGWLLVAAAPVALLRRPGS